MFDIISNFVKDPIGTTVKTTLSPITNAADVLQGLTEGELRTKAALTLGADVVSGMALSQVIEHLTE